MIQGIGIDITEIARIQQSILRNQKFIQRILTPNEQAHYNSLTSDKRRAEYAAGRFAAKEAYAKAKGTGLGKLSFQDIEIGSDGLGAPVVLTKDQEKVWVSITHTDAYAAAQIIIEKT